MSRLFSFTFSNENPPTGQELRMFPQKRKKKKKKKSRRINCYRFPTVPLFSISFILKEEEEEEAAHTFLI
jgi:hypothetical protein